MDEGAGFIILALRSPHLLEAERRQEKSSNPYRIGAITLIFVVNEANAVNSFVMRSTISRNMVVPLDNTTSYNSLRM